MIYFLFAMEREAEMLNAPNKHVIGIGAKSMPNTTKDDVIVNVGYCGASKMPIGSLVEPGFAADANTLEIVRIDRAFPVQSAVCVTADRFVENDTWDASCVYDMELFKIAQLPYKRIYSLKIVSDNLNEKQCESFDMSKSWEMAQFLINEFLAKRREEIGKGGCADESS